MNCPHRQPSWTTAQRKENVVATLESTLWLVACLSRQLGIPVRKLSDARVKVGSKGVTTHKQVTRVYGIYGGQSPGYGYPMSYVLGLARKYV